MRDTALQISLILLFLLGMTVLITETGTGSKSSKQKSEAQASMVDRPPMPLRKCDQYLVKADQSNMRAVIEYNAQLAIACYMSHLVRK